MDEKEEFGEIPTKGWAWNGHHAGCFPSSHISQSAFYTPVEMPPSDYGKGRKEQGGK